jgi:hypothetical protein
MDFELKNVTAEDADMLRSFADFLDGGGDPDSVEPTAPKRRATGGGSRRKKDTAINELAAAAAPMEAGAPPVMAVAPPVAPPGMQPIAPPVMAPTMPAPVTAPPVQQPVAVPPGATPQAVTFDDIRRAGAVVVQHPSYGQPFITNMMVRYGIPEGQSIELLHPGHMQQFFDELNAVAKQIAPTA